MRPWLSALRFISGPPSMTSCSETADDASTAAMVAARTVAQPLLAQPESIMDLSRSKAWIYGSWTKWPSSELPLSRRGAERALVDRYAGNLQHPLPHTLARSPLCPRPRPTHRAQLRRPACPNVLAFNLEGGAAVFDPSLAIRT